MNPTPAQVLNALREMELCTREFLSGKLVTFPAALLPQCREIIQAASLPQPPAAGQHTPGPWRIKTEHTLYEAVVLSPEIDGVSHILFQGDMGNAALIVKAPDMLDALRRISDGEFADNVPAAEQVAALRQVARAAL